MALRGKKPATIEKRLKCFFYGAPKVGKTTAAISFPRPYLIDCERGAENDQYVDALERNGGAIFQTTSFDEVIEEVKQLLSTNHEYKTLIIDPLTSIYNNLVDDCAKKLSASAKDGDGTAFGRHYQEAAKHMKRLVDLLMRLDMNVIITSHAKNEYGSKMEIVGTTFDCYKKLDYIFDLILEINKNGKKRTAKIKGSRIEGFSELDIIPFSYDEIADRYGREILERDAIPQELVSTEEAERLHMLIEMLHIDQEVIDKVLAKAKSTTIEEMPRDLAILWINSLSEKIKKLNLDDKDK